MEGWKVLVLASDQSTLKLDRNFTRSQGAYSAKAPPIARKFVPSSSNCCSVRSGFGYRNVPGLPIIGTYEPSGLRTVPMGLATRADPKPFSYRPWPPSATS